MTKKVIDTKVKPVLPLPPKPQINKPGNFGFKPNARFQSINRGRR
jgi:hypothetical protein